VGSNPTLSAIFFFLVYANGYVMLRFERRFGGVMAQSGLSIYQRNRTDRDWRYQRVEEGRGVKTGRIVGRFYVRPTQADGAQNWKPLTAESFEQAKVEHDRI
jgi:hypothetical protein